MALTKTVDGNALPQEKFAYVGDSNDVSTWHLPVDADHIDSALKMFGDEKHVPASQKGNAARRIAAEARKQGLDKDRISDFESKYCQTSDHGDFGSQWIQVFRAGQHRGQDFTEADLDRVIANYDPSVHEAPACIGHPEHDMPAYGWVSGLKRDGKHLLAQFRETDPSFEDAVKSSRFKKRSASFYLGTDGRITGLRHVGFLGALPPEVKGLKNLNFDDGGRGFVEVDFAEEKEVSDKTVKDQIKDFFAELFAGSQPGATKTFSEADVQRIVTDAITEANKASQTTIDTLRGDLTKLSTKFSERETSIATTEMRQRADAAVSKLKSAGKWVPAFERMGLSVVFGELAKVTATVEFGEGDSKKQVAPLDLMVSFMEGLPQVVPAGQLVNGVPSRATAKGTGDPLTDMARARAKEKNIAFGEALMQVAEENPQLTVPGGMAGSV